LPKVSNPNNNKGAGGGGRVQAKILSFKNPHIKNKP
jgi:hypothetical protein